MDESKRKTLKVMNLEIGQLKIEIILKVNTDDPNPLIVYQKGYKNKAGCEWPVKFRKKIATFRDLVTALDWLNNEYIRTGAWKKNYDAWSGKEV